MRYFGLIIFFSFFCLSSIRAQEASTQKIVSLKGHLNEETVAKARDALENLPSDQPIILEVNSQSGDLTYTFELVKVIVERKLRDESKVIVYIQENALGPAALLPFLADELLASVLVSWGDIVLNADTRFPTNILRSRVQSLIPSDHPKAELLRVIADAMVDPDFELVEVDGDWRRRLTDEGGGYSLVSPKGETLVMGQGELTRLGLVQGIVSQSGFRQRFRLPELKAEEVVASVKDGLPVNQEDLLASLKEHMPFDSEASHRIGHIKIDDRKQGINQSTWIYVKSALDYYKKVKPLCILVELNTPGGEVFAAQKISDALKEMDTQYGIPCIAYINNWAISAGAMITYSCRYIYVVKDASMGAAEPVFMGQGGKMAAAPEKVNSALRADFANRAGFFDRNPDIAEAMVDKDILLVLRFGEVVRLNSEDEIRKTGANQDEIITASGKLLTLDADAMVRLGVADVKMQPKKLASITEPEREKGKWPASKVLVFQQPYFSDIPDAVVDSYKPDWRVKLLSLLANPAVASFLFLGMMLGFYVEINTPGFGFPGSVALVCLAMIMLSSFALDIVNWLEVVLLLVGIALLAVEVFVIPGFGIAGVAGIILAVGGLFAIMLPGVQDITYDVDSQTLNAAGEVFIHRLAWLSGALVAGTGIMALMAKYVMPRIQAFNRLVLNSDESTAAGYSSVGGGDHFPKVGAQGVAHTMLRLSGKVRIDDELFDAQSDWAFIEQGTPIQVVRVEGNRVFVSALEESK